MNKNKKAGSGSKPVMRKLTLTIQDATTKDKVEVATVFGTLEAVIAGKVERIQFMTALDTNPDLKRHISSIAAEAIALFESKAPVHHGQPKRAKGRK